MKAILLTLAGSILLLGTGCISVHDHPRHDDDKTVIIEHHDDHVVPVDHDH